MRLRGLLLVLVVTVGAVLRGWVPTEAAFAGCGSWQYAAGASVRFGELRDVSASSGTDVWAVGVRDVAWGTAPLVEHWDGRTWTRVPSVGTYRPVQLTAVVAIAADDAWLAGRSRRMPFFMHWDGARWMRVLFPATAYRATVQDMTATSASDVWAVGSTASGRPRILHYDGRRWAVIPSASPRSTISLSSVSASAGDDAWAVGLRWSTAVGPYAEHWNGDGWSRIPVPQSGEVYNGNSPDVLAGVVAIGHGDAWEVGPQATHWNGTKWSIPPQPSPPRIGGLAGVAASGPNDVWALGWAASTYARTRVITEHWDGSAWTRSPSQRTSGARVLTDVAYAPGAAGAYWAVGRWSHGGSGRTPLIASYCSP